MGTYRFSVHIAAPPADVFALWLDLDRIHEWIEGVTKVSDVTGPPDQVGTRYIVWFGRMSSPTEVLAVDRPRSITTRFGNRLLRGRTVVRVDRDGEGTRLTQEFTTEGVIPAVVARIFATGSYKGSFRGELETFRSIAEREARREATRL